MQNQPRHWPIAVCDNRSASIFEATLVPPERIHLVRQERIITPWTDFHEHRRPDMLAMGPTANARQRFADEHREPLELERRFAKEVARWLRDVARKTAADTEDVEPPLALPVFVAPHFLGVLRSELGARTEGIELYRAELCGMPPHQVAQHPKVRELILRALLPRPTEGALRKSS